MRGQRLPAMGISTPVIKMMAKQRPIARRLWSALAIRVAGEASAALVVCVVVPGLLLSNSSPDKPLTGVKEAAVDKLMMSSYLAPLRQMRGELG